MVPYMSFLVQPFIGILESFPTDESVDADLWISVIETLTASFNIDEGCAYNPFSLAYSNPKHLS